MKYLMLVLIILSACANKGIDSKKATVSAQQAEGLSLIDAYQKTVTGGKEKDDGTHTSTNYSMVLAKADGAEVNMVYLYGEQMDFESFNYEGKFYIIVKFFPEVHKTEMGEMITTRSAADVFYDFKGDAKVLKVESFRINDATQAK